MLKKRDTKKSYKPENERMDMVLKKIFALCKKHQLTPSETVIVTQTIYDILDDKMFELTGGGIKKLLTRDTDYRRAYK